MTDDIQTILNWQWSTVGGYCSQDKAELYDLAKLVKDLRPERVLEIGVCEGGWLWCMEPFFAPGATIIGIDSLENPVIRIQNLRSVIARLGDKHPTTLIEDISQSEESLAKVKAILGGKPLDLLHIDGGHEEERARSDWERYAPLVRPGGIVAIHDVRGVGYREQEVDVLWAEIEAVENLTTFVLSHRENQMGIGVVIM